MTQATVLEARSFGKSSAEPRSPRSVPYPTSPKASPSSSQSRQTTRDRPLLRDRDRALTSPTLPRAGPASPSVSRQHALASSSREQSSSSSSSSPSSSVSNLMSSLSSSQTSAQQSGGLGLDLNDSASMKRSQSNNDISAAKSPSAVNKRIEQYLTSREDTSSPIMQPTSNSFNHALAVTAQPATHPDASHLVSESEKDKAQGDVVRAECTNGSRECRTGEQRPSEVSEASTPACLERIQQEQQEQQAPTIEQRDALASRVYDACLTAGYHEWLRLLDLAPLASQHHLSGYNCIKFGPQGSPYAYLPLSLQQPVQTQELLAKQKQNEAKAAEWLAQKRRRRQRKEAITSMKARRLTTLHDADGATASESSTHTRETDGSSPSSQPEIDGSSSQKSMTPENASKEAKENFEGIGVSVQSQGRLMRNLGSHRQVQAPRQLTAGQNPLLPRGLPRDDESPPRAGCPACAGRVDASCKDAIEAATCICGPLKTESVLSAEWEQPMPGSLGAATYAASSGEGTPANSASTTKSNLVDKEPPNAVSTPNPSQSHAIKTSDTHPISISTIIPPELLPVISDHVERGLPSSIKLADELAYMDREASDAAHAQLQTEGRRLLRCRVTQIDLSEVALKAERETIEAAHAQRKARQLIINNLNSSLPHLSAEEEAQIFSRPSHEIVPSTDRSLFCETACRDDTNGDEALANPAAAAKTADLSTDGEANRTKSPQDFVIGNLLLSSCPGKKVRLTGPVRGRGAICRDLGLDLRRIQQLGVGAIICCLDDDELGFLGAPWSHYEAEVDRLGIEVIRLPMAEGFSPTDVLATDKIISCVVNDYTLRGIHVLVHCRGGVGRAGLVACTWMLKLGLVRSNRDELRFRVPLGHLARQKRGKNTNGLGPANSSADENNANTADDEQAEEGLQVDSDVMQTIHRLVETIRRRRSPKAIETAEQVQFLVRYLNYLHRQEDRQLQYLVENTI